MYQINILAKVISIRQITVYTYIILINLIFRSNSHKLCTLLVKEKVKKDHDNSETRLLKDIIFMGRSDRVHFNIG